MKKEDTIVNYRPELAEILQDGLQFAQNLYTMNFQKAYYVMLSKTYEKNDPEYANILREASQCFDENIIYKTEKFRKNYEFLYELEYISEPRAAAAIFSFYEDSFDKIKSRIDMDSLTKSEKYMVDTFFYKLTSPIRNPNIQIKEGHSKCYYDSPGNSKYFHEDLSAQMEYINRECQITIDIFMTPDEQEKDCEESKSSHGTELSNEEIEKD